MPTDAIVFGLVMALAFVVAMAIYWGWVDPIVRPGLYGGGV